MEKKIILIFVCLILFSLFVSADTLNNYNVKDPVPVGQYTTAYGLFQDTDANIHGNVLCSFYLLDVNSVLIDRADDQYTDSLGYVMSKFLITEPNFKRGSTYIFRATCGGVSEDQNFYVGQRESIAHYGEQEFGYLLEEENVATVGIWFVMIVILAVICSGGYLLLKKRSRK